MLWLDFKSSQASNWSCRWPLIWTQNQRAKWLCLGEELSLLRSKKSTWKRNTVTVLPQGQSLSGCKGSAIFQTPAAPLEMSGLLPLPQCVSLTGILSSQEQSLSPVVKQLTQYPALSYSMTFLPRTLPSPRRHTGLCANWNLHGKQTAGVRRETVERTLALESETQALGMGPDIIRYQLWNLTISEPESVASSVR